MSETPVFSPPLERDMLVEVAQAARIFLKAHGTIEDWENAYEEVEALETALATWEEFNRER